MTTAMSVACIEADLTLQQVSPLRGQGAAPQLLFVGLKALGASMAGTLS